jgi:hypothetical protein
MIRGNVGVNLDWEKPVFNDQVVIAIWPDAGQITIRSA